MSNEVQTIQGKSLTANPFGGGSAVASQPSGGNALMTAEMQRQIAEIQAQFMMALHRPRVPMVAVDKMLLECQRPSLAEVALYSFSRGGTAINGLSIRALEMIARNWGNIKYGFRVLDRSAGRSVLQAYAYDLESNVPVERIFEVRHVRDKKGGAVPLTDERDIYELEANQAQRRVRACIEALIPGDVLDVCEDEIRKTLEARADTTADGIKKMLELFKAFGVNQKMIESRIQRNVTAITASQMVGLRSVYNSLKDGMSSIDQWFDKTLADSPDKKNAADDPNAALKGKIAEKSQVNDKPVEQSTTTEQQPDNKKTIGASQHLNDSILVMLNEAKTVDDIDLVWNNHADTLTELSKVDNANFKILDALYLKNRESLEKQATQQKTFV